MMLAIPSPLRIQFTESLRDKAIPSKTCAAYHNWLRYYLDFCHKSHFPPEQRTSLPHFLHKLRDKKQTTAQQEQAAQAISLYYEFVDSTPVVSTLLPSQEKNFVRGKPREKSTQRSDSASNEVSLANTVSPPGKVPSEPSQPPRSPFNTAKPSKRVRDEEKSSHPTPKLSEGTPPSQEGNLAASPRKNLSTKRKTLPELSEKNRSVPQQVRTGQGTSWKAEYIRLATILQSRSYDPKTVKAYTRWVRKFQAFTRSKPPELLSSEDAREFLASLMMKRRMTLSKQNQVFDALLFFYTHVLKKEFEVIRPTRPPDHGSSSGEAHPSHSVSPADPVPVEPH